MEPNPNPKAVTFVDPRDDRHHVRIIGFGSGFPGQATSPGQPNKVDELCGSAFLENSCELDNNGIRLSAQCPVSGVSATRSFTNAEAAFQALNIWSEASQFNLLSGQQALRFKMQFEGAQDWTYGGYGSAWLGMFAVLRAKFCENEACKQALLDTGNAFLVECNSKLGKDHLSDFIFGYNKNWLGLQLMLIRDELGGGESDERPTWTHFISETCGIDFNTGEAKSNVGENGNIWLTISMKAINEIKEILDQALTPIQQDNNPRIETRGQPCFSPNNELLPDDALQTEAEIRRVVIRKQVSRHIPPLSQTHPVEKCVTQDLQNPSLMPTPGVQNKMWWNTVFYMPETVEDVKPMHGCQSAHRGGVGGEGTQGAMFSERFVRGPDQYTFFDQCKIQRMAAFYGEKEDNQNRVLADLRRLEMERRQFLEDQSGNVIHHVVEPSDYVDSHTKSPLFKYHNKLMTAEEIWHEHGLWVDTSKFRGQPNPQKQPLQSFENNPESDWSPPCELPMPSWPFSTGPSQNPYRRDMPISMSAYRGGVPDDLPAEEFTKSPSFFDKGFMSLIDKIF